MINLETQGSNRSQAITRLAGQRLAALQIDILLQNVMSVMINILYIFDTRY